MCHSLIALADLVESLECKQSTLTERQAGARILRERIRILRVELGMLQARVLSDPTSSARGFLDMVRAQLSVARSDLRKTMGRNMGSVLESNVA